MDNLCPVCGEDEMEHWNMGIYECSNCGAMIPLDDVLNGGKQNDKGGT